MRPAGPGLYARAGVGNAPACRMTVDALARSGYGNGMSQKKTYSISCPKCHQELQVELYEAVNTGLDPILRDGVLRNQLNQVVCEQCEASFRVDKPLLYNDPSRRIMIYLVPLRQKSIAAGQEEFAQCLRQMSGLLPQDLEVPDVHLVFSQVELVERIFLLEAGLDERVVEYVKYLIYSRNLGKLNPAQKILLFNAEDSTAEQLCFVVQDAQTRHLEALLHFERKAYTALCELFDTDEHTANLLEMFPGPYVSARALYLHDENYQGPDIPPAKGRAKQ